MSSAPRGSQLSGSTAFNSSTQSLNSLSSAQTVVTPMSSAGGPVVATANIINQKADASRSLYQICISLRQRLSQVPGFEVYLEQVDANDPVDSLWNLFRTGVPFLAIFNVLQPAEPIGVDEGKTAAKNKPKIAVFKFVEACLKELNISSADCFVINDVLGNDTSGFVKACSRPLAPEPGRAKTPSSHNPLTAWLACFPSFLLLSCVPLFLSFLLLTNVNIIGYTSCKLCPRYCRATRLIASGPALSR